jgi:hypothetical protein
MKTKKQVILVFNTPLKYKKAIDFLLSANVVFNGLKNKYIRISQKTFKKFDCIDLYTDCDNIFSSVI